MHDIVCSSLDHETKILEIFRNCLVLVVLTALPCVCLRASPVNSLCIPEQRKSSSKYDIGCNHATGFVKFIAWARLRMD